MEQATAELTGTTYQGSFLFASIANAAGLPIDQFNFLFSEFFALFLAVLFRKFLPAKPSHTFIRHVVASILGIALGFFCFGTPIYHIFLQSSIVYALLYFLPASHSHLVVFVFSMIYMSAVHIHRLIYDYGNYTLDVSGPLMINTQKLTALAFAFYDGYRAKKDKMADAVLNEDQKKQKIDSMPNPLEFLSYIFYFHGICVGPLCFYRDYINYIEGSHLIVIPNSSKQRTTTNEPIDVHLEQPSPLWPVITKLGQCVLWAYILLFFTPKYTIEYNLSAEMINSPWVKRLSYLLFSTFCTRGKYYFAFILSEAVNNAAGLGFNGYDQTKDNRPDWSLLTNVKPFELESATSLKVIIDVWNIQTGLWLRRVCYDRLKNNRTLGVFVLSAFWHGFYPGYYVCFLLAAVETHVGRGIRRTIRPHFQKTQPMKILYGLLTWLGAQIALNFAVTPFVLLEIRKSLLFYQTWYFSFPIICVILALILPGGSSKPSKK